MRMPRGRPPSSSEAENSEEEEGSGDEDSTASETGGDGEELVYDEYGEPVPSSDTNGNKRGLKKKFRKTRKKKSQSNTSSVPRIKGRMPLAPYQKGKDVVIIDWEVNKKYLNN